MDNSNLVKHPIVQDLITKLRDVNTNTLLFRIYSRELTTFLLFDALKDLDVRKKDVTTQTGAAYEGVAFNEKLAFISILRASLGMLSTAMEVFPEGEFHAVGVKRNEEDPFNAKPNFYFGQAP